MRKYRPLWKELHLKVSQGVACRAEAVIRERQNKNVSIQTKTIPILKLPRFSPHQIGGE